MCFSNKYKYRTIHGGCYWTMTKNKTSRKGKNKHFLKILLSSFSIFHTKILCMTNGGFTLKEALNSYGLSCMQ